MQQEDQQVCHHQLHLDKSLDDISFVIISACGPASIYTQQYCKNPIGSITPIGKRSSDQSALAKLYKNGQVLIIQYCIDVKYFYYEQYNLRQLLKLKDVKYIILCNVPATSLENYNEQESQLRCLNKGFEVKGIKALGQVNFEGYFGELFEDLQDYCVLALILVQTEYDLALDIIVKYDQLRSIIPTLGDLDKSEIKENIKKYRKQVQRDNVYL